jgi:hypothetical protein
VTIAVRIRRTQHRTALADKAANSPRPDDEAAASVDPVAKQDGDDHRPKRFGFKSLLGVSMLAGCTRARSPVSPALSSSSSLRAPTNSRRQDRSPSRARPSVLRLRFRSLDPRLRGLDPQLRSLDPRLRNPRVPNPLPSPRRRRSSDDLPSTNSASGASTSPGRPPAGRRRRVAGCLACGLWSAPP